MNRYFRLLVLVAMFTMGILAGMILIVSFARAKSSVSTTPAIIVDTLEDELNGDGDCSLREAIQAVNTDSAVDACSAGDGVISDTITFAVSGTITLDTQLDINAGGSLVIDGGEAIAISGGSSVRTFYVNSEAELTLESLSITDGSADEGGGIFNSGNLTLKDSTLSRSVAWSSYTGGGGIYNTGRLTITNSTLSGNHTFYHIGGGIYNLGQLTISDSDLTSNSAYHDGGGIYNSGALTVTNSTLSGNSVNYSGGGIYNYSGTISLINSTLSANRALNGGGLYNHSKGVSYINNSTLSGNNATQAGGGIFTQGELTMSNTTLSNNNAGDFGGGINGGGLGLTLRNTILANNSSGVDGPDCYVMAVSTGGYNLLGDASGCAFIPTSGDLINVSANLGPLQDYGGPTYTQALLRGSPAIDAGDPAGCTDHLGNPITIDQRGVIRVGRCDIGSYEYDPASDPFHYISLPIVSKNMCSDFFDDFSNPNSGWPVGEDNLMRVEYLNGEYRVVAKSDEYIYLFRAPTCDRQDYTVEMDARWVAKTGNSYGLIFNIQGEFDSYYLFEVNTDFQGFSLHQRNPTGWTEIVPPAYSAAINTGTASNHLKVTHSKTGITLEVNGTILGTWSEITPAGPGGVGLAVSAYKGEPNVDARFDNFQVTHLPGAATVTSTDAHDAVAIPTIQLPENLQRVPDLLQDYWRDAIHR